MIIDLTKSVPLTELCRITAIGYTTEAAQWIEFTFSHEAMIGFATELLWLYEDIDDNRKLNLCTHQLLTDPSPNQVVGFYLTPDSPILFIKINPLTQKKEEGVEYKNWKEIYIRSKNSNQYYKINDPSEEDIEKIFLEPYELSKRNIMKINVFNSEGKNITNAYSTVIFEMNRGGMKDLATMLLVWANNHKKEDEYDLPYVDKPECGYNLGLGLTRDSISAKFKCQDLGTAFDYDPKFV